MVDTEKEASFFAFEYIYSTLSSKNKVQLTQYLQKDSYFRLKLKTPQNEYWLRTEEVSSETILAKDQSFHFFFFIKRKIKIYL